MPSVGMKETETRVGSSGVVRGIEPVAARIRPQLEVRRKRRSVSEEVWRK